MSDVFLVRNDSGEDVELKSFGLIIGDGLSVDLCCFDKACRCSELDSLLSSGDLVRVIDGIDMPYARAFIKGMTASLIPVSGYPAIIGGNQTGFLRILGGDLGISAIENYNQVRMPACTIKGISGIAHSYSSDLTLTIRKNGEDTSLTGTITEDGSFRFTGSVDFADGDLLSIGFSTSPGGGCAASGVVVENSRDVV